MLIVVGKAGKIPKSNSQRVAVKVVKIMHISNKQEELPLSSLNFISIGMSFSYVACASEGNFFLSTHLPM